MYNTNAFDVGQPLTNNNPIYMNTEPQGEYRCKSIKKTITTRTHLSTNPYDRVKSSCHQQIANQYNMPQKQIVPCKNTSSEINILDNIIKKINTLKDQSPLVDSVPAKIFNKGISDLDEYACKLNTEDTNILHKLKISIRKTFRESSKYMMTFNKAYGNIDEALSQQFADIKGSLIEYIDNKNTSLAICSVNSIRL